MTVRLVPVPTAVDPAKVVPVAAEIYRRAHGRIGPGGLADLESTLDASAEVTAEVARGGKDVRNASGAKYSVRLCNTLCEFRSNGGPGCGIYQELLAVKRDLDGQQCEHDLVLIRSMEKVFVEGDADKIRELAGRFSGAVVLQIQRLLESIIADGGTTEEPIFDAKGQPVYNEEQMLNVRGEPAFDRDGQPVKRRFVLTRKKEHHLFGRLTQLLKETRLIDFSEWQLTPKSSGAVGKSDGMILLEEQNGGERKTVVAVVADLKGYMDKMTGALARSRERTEKDPACVAARESLAEGLAATPTVIESDAKK